MGGKVLEYEAKDILRQGIAQGHAEGHAEGHASGFAEGEKNKLLLLIQKKLAKGKSSAQIAEDLEETEEVILKLMEEMK